ncbi:MFS transporter [Rhodococcus sp. Z13]|uniref:MFS transporter n=1 Tax=Rhodococcus sacchari TaxID=2962047 RepID=A0ACD4DD42_9NOCA|nr:MFS transporter [Rhodococcus sp. Z13]UYP17922.1 MFS transporter [Rhodococcus sp. Z13]
MTTSGELTEKEAGTGGNPAMARRAAFAGGVGTVIEYYDFSVYGFLALTLAPLFFPEQDPATATLSALAVFASSYLVRPLGGWFFGILGDRRGRRFALVATVLLMSVACIAMGLLPTYLDIGISATVAIVIVRLVQGFAAGGEVGGAATYVAELAPAGRRGVYGSSTAMGATFGFAVAAAVVGVVRLGLTPEQMQSWGWRIPFLISVVFAALALWGRLRLEDSPQFRALEESLEGKTVEKRPLAAVIRSHPLSVLRVLGMSVALNGTVYIGLTYFGIFLQRKGNISPTAIAWIAAAGIAIAVVTFPLPGLLSDRFDRKPVLMIGYVALALVAWPAFSILSTTSSIALAIGVYVVYMFFNGFVQVPTYALAAELFPTNVRYTGIALGYNLGTIIAGGTAPLIAEMLVQRTGSDTSPAGWVILVAVVGLVSVATVGRTASKALPQS